MSTTRIGDSIPIFKDTASLNSYLLDNVLKQMTEQAGRQVNEVIREYIESSFYDQYEPLVYRRTYQLLNSVTTAKPTKIANGYEIEIFLDEDKATYYDSIDWRSGKVGEEVDTGMVFNFAAHGRHGPNIQTWGRFMNDAANDLQGLGTKEIIRNFRKYLKSRGFIVK